MKRLTPSLILVVATLPLFGCGATEDRGASPSSSGTVAGSWQADRVESGWFSSDRPLLDVVFVDDRRGWVVNQTGGVLYTEDAGNSWARQLKGGEDAFTALAASDGTHVWAGTTSGLWRSSDGGKHWGYADVGYCEDVYFIDSRHGWLVGGGRDPAALDSFVVSSSDGGASWSTQLEVEDCHLLGLWATDADHVWVVGGAKGGGVAYATTDGGRSWQRQRTGSSPSLQGVTFVDAERGWAVGGLGSIIATTDGGKHWHEQRRESAEREILLSVSFADARHGWAVGSRLDSSTRARIVRTEDGGRHWTRERAPKEVESQPLEAVWFESPEHGWAVGGGFVLRRTSPK